MESIGQRLKQARLAKNLSIEQAQKETRISNRILFALENDKPEHAISGNVYIKSFIKKYANYLGINGSKLSDEYMGEHPISKEEAFVAPKAASSFNFPIKKILIIIVAVVIIFAAVKALIFAGSSIIKAIKSRPRVVKKVQPVKPKPVTDTKEAQKPKLEETKPAAAPAAAPIAKSENLSLGIKAKRDTYLKVISDGNVIYDGIFKKNSTETWNAKNSFDLSTSRAESLIVELNGTSLGALGKGVTKNITITKDGIKH